MRDEGQFEPILAAAIAASVDCIIVADEQGRILEFNPAAERCFGYSRTDAIGQRVADLIVPDDLRDVHEMGLMRYVTGGPPRVLGRRVETEARRKDGHIFPVELTVTEVRSGRRRVFAATLRDLSTEATRQELEVVRHRLELAVEGAELGIWSFSPLTEAIWFSKRSREIYGFTDDEPLNIETLRAKVHPQDWERLAAPYYAGFPDHAVSIEYRAIRPSGEIRWIYALGAAARDEDGVAQAVHGIHVDVTARKHAEEELSRSRDALAQSERLAAMGALLAGVSHELNNPLAAIVGQAEMLLEDAVGTSFEERARKIGAAAERCARIVQTFLAMARHGEPQPVMVDMNEVIASALEITEYALRTAGISVRVNFGTGLPTVRGDRDQLHQVLVNLIVNAQQAMDKGEAFEKVLMIRTSVNQAGEILVDVVDTGPGVPEAVRHRIFEPFFTTKRQSGGTGTGIGLSFSQGIVEAHGGAISVEPSRRGAHLRIALPPAQGGTAPVVLVPPVAEMPAFPLERRRALIVEDEADVAETLRELIEREGYEVTVAANGTEAFYALDHAEFDILFSDLRMPLLNGPELYERLKEIRPQLVESMAFVTGDTMGDSMGEFLKAAGRPVLEKPFTKAGIRAVLAALVVCDRT